MVLTEDIKKKIIDFVHLQPRSMEEIARHINKNWRTANRYVEEIIKKEGIIACKVFRKGSKGALKIVYWNYSDRIYGTSYQRLLEEKIRNGKEKHDFSPFDIYQFVQRDKKSAFIEKMKEYRITERQDLIGVLRKAEQNILIFSGDFSWAVTEQGKIKLLDVVREVASNNIFINVICRVDLLSMNNIKSLLEINRSVGKDMIRVRHYEMPLRGVIIDNKLARFKETRSYEIYGKGEKENIYIFYTIYDKEWIEWLRKLFYSFFNSAIDAEKRIRELETIKET